MLMAAALPVKAPRRVRMNLGPIVLRLVALAK
jgi:hypothetical protein